MDELREILLKLGFESVMGNPFRMIRNDIAVSISTMVIKINESLSVNSSTSIFLIEKVDKSESDALITEMFFNEVDYLVIRRHILKFFQSDIRDLKLTYLLD
jgi:hypothetical protein